MCRNRKLIWSVDQNNIILYFVLKHLKQLLPLDFQFSISNAFSRYETDNKPRQNITENEVGEFFRSRSKLIPVTYEFSRS